MWSVSFGVHDGEGHKSLVEYNFPDSVTVAQLDSWIAIFQPLLQALLQGDAREVRYSRTAAVFTAGTADPGSDVEIKAKFIWQPLNTIKKWIQSIPTFDRGKIVQNSDTVDFSDPDISAFVTAITDGIDIGGAVIVRPTDSEERLIDGVITGKEDYGKKRN